MPRLKPKPKFNVSVRALQEDDAPRVAELIKQLTPRIVQPRKLRHRIRTLVWKAGSWALVATDPNGKVVGFAMMAVYLIPSKGNIGIVEEVISDEKLRGLGIGKKLMRELRLIAEQNGLDRIILISKGDAVPFYETLGFVIKDEVPMVLKLKTKRKAG